MFKKMIIAGFAAIMLLAAPSAFAQNNDPPAGTDLVLLSRQFGNGAGKQGAIPLSAMFNLAGVGYSTGGGGAVTQITSRTTGVTLNANSGAITLISAAGSTTPASFTVTNSKVAATDVIVINQRSGTDLYTIDVTAVGAGTFQVTFNTKSGTTTEQPVFSFVVIKGAAS